jgi:hypothetical protein
MRWNFRIYLILPAALGPGAYTASNRNEYWKKKKKRSWGVKCGWCVGLTTLPPSMSGLSRQCGILNISQPYRPPRPVNGDSFIWSQSLCLPNYLSTSVSLRMYICMFVCMCVCVRVPARIYQTIHSFFYFYPIYHLICYDFDLERLHSNHVNWFLSRIFFVSYISGSESLFIYIVTIVRVIRRNCNQDDISVAWSLLQSNIGWTLHTNFYIIGRKYNILSKRFCPNFRNSSRRQNIQNS